MVSSFHTFWDWEKTLCVTWEVTRKCNLTCRFCRVRSDLKDGLSYSQIEEGLNQLSSWESCHITWTGGEPLIRNDFFSIVKCSSKLGIYQGICTNGLLLNSKKIEALLDNNIEWIMLSLDGIKSTHDIMRNRPGSFDKTLESVKKLISFRKNSSRPKIKIHSIINDLNFPTLKQFVKLIDGVGVDEIQFRPEFNSLFSPSSQLIDLVLQLADELKSLSNLNIDFEIFSLLKNQKANNKLKSYCFTGSNFFHIDYMGQILPCCIVSQDCMESEIYINQNILELFNKGQLKSKMENIRSAYRNDHRYDPCNPCWLKTNNLFVNHSIQQIIRY